MTRDFYRLAMPGFQFTRSAIYHNTDRTLCDRLSWSDQVAEHHKGGINRKCLSVK